MLKKNENKILNVPNEREQNQTCLDSAERAALRHKGNVPNLRFPEFTDEWKCFLLSDLLDFFPTNSLSWDKLEYGKGDLRNLHYGLIHVGLQTLVDLSKNQLPMVKPNNFPRNFEIIKEGDVAFADASEDTNDVAKAIEFIYTDEIPSICGLHTIHGRDKLNLTVPGFKGYYFSSNAFHDQIKRIAQGTKIFSVSPKLLSECKICLPSRLEQKKISSLLSLIDERIETQYKIIEKLQSLISGIERKIFSLSNKKLLSCELLGEVCTITTGKIDANAMAEEGEYPFFTCAQIPYKINEYAFDCEALLISGNGANVGYINYYKGKFNAYQRTYILTNFTQNIFYIQFYLNVNLHRRIALQKNTGNTPYIVLSTLVDMPIFLPPIEEQKSIAIKLRSLYSLLKIENEILVKYKEQRSFLLNQMFI